MNDLNFEAKEAGYPINISIMVPEEQSQKLDDALSAVTQVLARYELIDHLAKTDETIGSRRSVDQFCVALLEANQEDLARAVPDAMKKIDVTYINEMANSYEACQNGATLTYDDLRRETKLAIFAASQLKDEVLDNIAQLSSAIEVSTPFDLDDDLGIDNEADFDFAP